MLTPEDIAAASGITRAQWSQDFLRGRVGPLADMGCEFGGDVSVAAYMVHVAWGQGWTRGHLSGRPGYEAVDMMGSRVRAAASRSGSLAEWGSSLVRDVGGRLEAMHADDLLWWRRQVALATPNVWRRLRQRQQLEDVLAAWGILRDALRELKEAT